MLWKISVYFGTGLCGRILTLIAPKWPCRRYWSLWYILIETQGVFYSLIHIWRHHNRLYDFRPLATRLEKGNYWGWTALPNWMVCFWIIWWLARWYSKPVIRFLCLYSEIYSEIVCLSVCLSFYLTKRFHRLAMLWRSVGSKINDHLQIYLWRSFYLMDSRLLVVWLPQTLHREWPWTWVHLYSVLWPWTWVHLYSVLWPWTWVHLYCLLWPWT